MYRTSIRTLLISAACILTIMVAVTGALGQNAGSPGGGRAEAAFKDIKVLQGTPADQLIPTMQFFEASLGVTCNYCHLADRVANTPIKETARQMISMVKAINRDNFKGAKTVTCNTCHRGGVEPAANPALATANYKPWTPDSPNGAPALSPVPGPPATQLIDNYLKTLGGEAGLAKLQSRVVKYTATNSIGNVANMELVSKGDNGLSITHGADGDVIVGHAGNSAWQRAANGAVRDAREDEFDALRLQDPLYLARNLKSITNLETRRARIDNQQVYQLRGTAFGHVPVRLFFNPKSGNLVRVVFLLQNVVGQNVVRIDYSDFRNVQGTAFPFSWIIARPLGYQTVKVDSVQQNLTVEDTRFAKPTGRSN
jgi:photosynthetic reaction center cytochrome c subunit